MTTSKAELYDQLAAQLSSLLAGEHNLIANASTVVISIRSAEENVGQD